MKSEEKNNIHFGAQYSFHPKHSTADARAKFTVHVPKAMENIMSMFLDLFNAFDTK